MSDEITIKGFVELLKNYPPNVISRAAVRATNRTLTSVRKEISIRMREKVDLKASEVKDAIILTPATIKDAQRGEVLGSIKIFAKRIPLIRFSPVRKVVKTAKGVRTAVSVNRGSGRKVEPGAFIVELKNGRMGIFRRREGANDTAGRDAAGRVKRGRLPIDELFDTGLAKMVESKDFFEGIQSFASDRFQTTFESELKFYMEQEVKRLSKK